MKKIIYIKQIVAGIFSLCLFIGLTSCNEFLEENPKNSFTIDQYFAEADHARAAVNALYRRGFPELYNPGGAYTGPNIMLGGYLSGFFDNEYSGQELYVRRCQDLEITPQNEVGTRLNGIWDANYNAISRANTAIKYIPETPGLDATEATYLLAQAKFFRALNYFYMVKTFGDVPLLLEPYESSMDNFYVERMPAAEIYVQIEKDLKDAVAGLKDTLFTDNFRVTKHTANAVLANVYLQWSGYPLQVDHYALAAAAAKAVINGNKHSLVQKTNNVSPYNILRTEDKNPEIVYAMEYNASISDGGSWPSYSATGEVEGKKLEGENLFKFDIMKNVYAVAKAYYNSYDTTSDIRAGEGQFFYRSYKGYTYECKGYPEQIAHLCNWFYFEEDAMLSGAKASKDKPIIRYAEVLLTAAEAIAKSEGVTDEAVGYLKQVRGRADVGGVSTLPTGMTKDDFIKEVWSERLREFPLEFKVWDDIQRTRQYPQTDANNPGFITWVNVIGADNPWGKTFQEKHLLWPIPANEIQRNPQLTQNHGY